MHSSSAAPMVTSSKTSSILHASESYRQQKLKSILENSGKLQNASNYMNSGSRNKLLFYLRRLFYLQRLICRGIRHLRDPLLISLQNQTSLFLNLQMVPHYLHVDLHVTADYL